MDDMISSGDSMLEVAQQSERPRSQQNLHVLPPSVCSPTDCPNSTKPTKKALFDRILTTNLIYQTPELLTRPYYINCDMSKYIALIIDTLNHDDSISKLLNPVERIQKVLTKYRNNETI